MTAQPMIRRDNAERRRLENLIRGACFDAKREMPKVGTADYPTLWDACHEYLDELLDELDALTCPALTRHDSRGALS